MKVKSIFFSSGQIYLMIYYFLILFFIFILYICGNKSKLNGGNGIFYKVIENNSELKIINTQPSILYNKKNIKAFLDSVIIFEIYNKIDNNTYKIIRYPDFRNEIERHSYNHINKYLDFFKKNIIKENEKYILDFIGFHGIIDNKVNLWISLYKKYSRNIADEIMGETYLIPNDKKLFEKEYNKNNKYILKNSFGGARSGLSVSNDLKEILKYFDENKLNNFNPIMCEDAVCHSKVKYNIVQKFIEPSFLYKGFKMGLRLFLVITKEKNDLKSYLFKDGGCYYSQKKYNKSSTNLDNNVVGVFSKTNHIIEQNSLPITYKEFEKEIIKTKEGQKKIDNLISKLKKYCKYIINSNYEKLSIFNQNNIKSYSIFALDIEFNKEFKPYIFEGNYYFARWNNGKRGNVISNLYNDVYYQLGLKSKQNIGFWNI